MACTRSLVWLACIVTHCSHTARYGSTRQSESTKVARAEWWQKSKKAAAAEEEIESEPEDDVPLGVVAKLPSDKALRAQVEKILASVDVRDFNLRALMEQLGELPAHLQHSLQRYYFASFCSRAGCTQQLNSHFCCIRGAS